MAVDYERIHASFKRDAGQMFENNTDYYSDNDINYLKKMNQMYGYAMSAKGLNVLDPIYSNFFHYNKQGILGNTDYPRITKTYAFFTRPELNFSFENIQSVPFFKWLYSKRVGKMIMASLTDPEYFINGPGSLNNSNLSPAQVREIVNEFTKWYTTQHKEFDESGKVSSQEYRDAVYGSDEGGSVDFAVLKDQPNSLLDDAIAKYNEAAEASEDNSEEVARLEGMDFGSLYDSATLDGLKDQFDAISNNYSKYYSSYEESKSDGAIAKLAAAFAYKDKDQMESALLSRGLMKAKNIFRKDANHKMAFDYYNFTSPFIPLLGNTCTQVTGAKDMQLDSHTYEEDEFGKTLQVPTGMDSFWGPGSVTTNFNDIAYGPVSLMFMVWIMYIHYVSRGFIMTTREHITERILDYTCSIYVFMVGEDGRRIERWCKYTGCYPTTFPLSSQIEHNVQIEQDMLQKVTISWNYNDFEAMDPQTFMDFNFLSESEWLVKLRSPLWEDLYNRHRDLTDVNSVATDYTKLSEEDKQFYNDHTRPPQIWERIKPEDYGMSGKLPAAIIEADDPDSFIKHVNNYWGGYPWINKGTELIWVLPQYGQKEGVVRDRFSGDNSVPQYGSTMGNAVHAKSATNWEHGRNVEGLSEPDKSTWFIGNATFV